MLSKITHRGIGIFFIVSVGGGGGRAGADGVIKLALRVITFLRL